MKTILLNLKVVFTPNKETKNSKYKCRVASQRMILSLSINIKKDKKRKYTFPFFGVCRLFGLKRMFSLLKVVLFSFFFHINI